MIATKAEQADQRPRTVRLTSQNSPAVAQNRPIKSPQPAGDSVADMVDRRVRLVVLFGGRSAEHAVSCVSARHVIAAADSEKYLVEPVGITTDGTWVRAEAAAEALQAGTSELPERLSAAGPPVDPLAVLGTSGATGSPAVPGASAAADVVIGGKRARARHSGPTVVAPILHGPMGEDGTVQGLLDLASVAYVGAGVLSSALCMDKTAAKTMLAQGGIAQVRWRSLTVDDPSASNDDLASDIEAIVEDLGLPAFVKPARMGSSVGVSLARTRDELADGLRAAGCYDRLVIVEERSRGREIEIAVIGNDGYEAILPPPSDATGTDRMRDDDGYEASLPPPSDATGTDQVEDDDGYQVSLPGEIVPAADFYDYDDKYGDGAELHVPAPLANTEVAEAQRLAMAACRALRVEGMARVDFFYEDGRNGRGDRGWLVNELNTMPGFTPISMFPKLWHAGGLTYGDLIDRLVELALQRHARRQRHTRTDPGTTLPAL